MQVSIVIPALNEAGNIGALVRETCRVAGTLVGEVIVVDDGSSDGTAAELAALLDAEPRLRVIRHAATMGQSAAVHTGARAARHAIVVTMDGDGQNDPADIAALAAAVDLDRGPQLVGGIRAKRLDRWSKRVASRVANAIRRAVLRDACPDTGCGIKAWGREAYLGLPFFAGQHRYLPALFRAYGYSTSYRPVRDRPRRAGQSKYTNLGRALLGIYDLIGVSWLIRRARRPVATEIVVGGSTPARIAAPATTEQTP